MPRKRTKTKEKLGKFEPWELVYMKNGPPPWEIARESIHRWHYLDGRDIWERLKKEPDFNEKDYPWAVEVYK